MYNRGRKSIPLGFTDRAMKKLMAYDWPGNVRELQNLVQRMCILHGGDTVDADALPQKFQDLNDPSEPEDTTVVEIKNEKMDFHAMTMEFENQLILKALHMAGGNKKEAANLLNMKRTTLLEKIKKRKLDLKN
jgi:DNA-binding NtrC family response regulator